MKDRYIVIILCLIRFAYFMDFMIMMPLGNYLMSSLNIGPHEFGILVSSYTFAAGVSGFLNGMILDRFSKKNVLLFVFINFTLATFLCGISPSYETLLASRIYAGLFGGILSSMIYSILSDFISYEKRGKAMGILMAASSLAFVIGPPIALSLTVRYSWNAPFLALVALSTLLILVAYVYLPQTPRITSSEKLDLLAPYKLALTDKSQRNAILLIIMLAFGQYSTIPFLSPYLQLNLQVSSSQLALYLSLAGFFSIVSSILVGKLSDQFGKHRVAFSMIFLSTVSIAMITNLTSLNPYVIAFNVILFFFSITGRLVPSLTIITAVSTQKHQSSFMTIQNSVQHFASAFATFTASLIIKKEEAKIEHLSIIGLIGIASSLIACILIYKITARTDEHC